MADDTSGNLDPQAKKLIRRYIVRLAIAGATLFGAANLVALFTVVPELAANRVTQSEAVKKVRDEALVAGGVLQESVRRARQDLDEVERAVKDISDKVEAFKRTDTAKAIERTATLDKLNADGKSLLDAIAAIRSEIPTRIVLAGEPWQSEPFANENQRDCPTGAVQIGAHLGIGNRDMRIRCRQIALAR